MLEETLVETCGPPEQETVRPHPLVRKMAMAGSHPCTKLKEKKMLLWMSNTAIG